MLSEASWADPALLRAREAIRAQTQDWTSLLQELIRIPSHHEAEHAIVRYARTLTSDPDDPLVFEYLSLQKTRACFEPLAEYVVELRPGIVRETMLRPDLSVHAPHRGAPLHEGTAPGSYAPLEPVGAART